MNVFLPDYVVVDDLALGIIILQICLMILNLQSAFENLYGKICGVGLVNDAFRDRETYSVGLKKSSTRKWD